MQDRRGKEVKVGDLVAFGTRVGYRAEARLATITAIVSRSYGGPTAVLYTEGKRETAAEESGIILVEAK